MHEPALTRLTSLSVTFAFCGLEGTNNPEPKKRAGLHRLVHISLGSNQTSISPKWTLYSRFSTPRGMLRKTISEWTCRALREGLHQPSRLGWGLLSSATDTFHLCPREIHPVSKQRQASAWLLQLPLIGEGPIAVHNLVCGGMFNLLPLGPQRSGAP